MTLEEAQTKITELTDQLKDRDGKIVEFTKNAGKQLSEDDLEKIRQKADNQGFDRAKKQFETEKKDFISKGDVDKMLEDRDHLFATKTELLKMGVKNVDKAIKVIDEDDLESFGTADFKSDDFKTKYEDSIVFGEAGGKPPHKPFTKDNKKPPHETVTADNYDQLSEKERNNMSDEDKLALIK
ncbi:MAG: hypothetical protein KAH30_04430 [Caldisericia bacterium]|nr:hypothetical protein [Caldisericia bacterium]